MSVKLGGTEINKVYLGSAEIKKVYLGSNLVYVKYEVVEFPFTTQSTANILIKTIDDSPYFIDWGDGNTIEYASSPSYNTYNYAVPTSGVMRIISTGVIRLQCTSGSFDFTNVSNLTMLSERLYLLSNSFTGDMSGISNLTSLTNLFLLSNSFTGNMSNVNNLNLLTYLYLEGVGLTGDMSGVGSLTLLRTLYLNSDSFTGNVSGISNLSLLTFLRLVSSQLTYTYTTLTSNFGDFYLRLKTNELSSSTDIDNMLIDIDNNATVKSGTIDLRSTGAGSPTSASLSARDSLIAKGRTILTN